MRKLAFLVLLAPALLLNACSSGGGSDTPAENAPHPENWVVTHGAQAKPAAPGYRECVVCHGTDFKGGNDVPSCFSCHSFNEAPPFTIHPPGWDDPYIDHRAYAALNGKEACKACHGDDLHGEPPAPSCFSVSFDGAACHPGGPKDVPHPLDGTFLNGTIHGPFAKADLTVCQACHGQPGGPGTNPRFNLGIFSAGGHGCENCHPTNAAHPVNWGESVSPTHSTAENIQGACTLCHGVDLQGGVGPSCLECHGLNPGDNPGCVSCHNVPPDGNGPIGNVRPNESGMHAIHTQDILTSLTLSDPSTAHNISETCSVCHFGVGSGTNTHFDNSRPAAVVFSSDPAWVDRIGVTILSSDATNTTCTGQCHLATFTFHHEVLPGGAKWYNP